MNGITYYRLKSDYTGDYTKNCALNGQEVDNNFYVLEGRDVKSIAVKDKDLVITLMDGSHVSAEGVLDFVKTEDMKTSVVNVEFDKLNGVLKLTNADGTMQHIEGFATNENTDFSVSTDNTLFGDGLRNAPLGVAPSYRTGQFKTVKSIVNVAEGGSLPSCGNIMGDRYVTCEDISDYGYLYDYKAVRDIACELKKSGWRIPTKGDWDDLFNAIEPCECDKDHEKADKNKFLGKWAGKLLKSKTMWKDGCCSDSCDTCGSDDSCDNSHSGHDDCGCHKKKDCDCEKTCVCADDVCFDYTDDRCVGTREREANNKCEQKCDGHNGLDSFGFRVTPTGYADDGCNFGYFKERSAFWTATTNDDNTKAYIKRFHYNKDGVYQDVIASNYHLSLRLVKDYNGKNYFDVEEIMDMEYPTLLLPSVKNGKSIWLSTNFACGNASFKPMLPNNGQGITFTRHYFINEWDGFKWVRNEMKQGDTVTVDKAPNGKKMVEYRVIGNDFISVNEMVYDDVVSSIQPILDEMEESLQEADRTLEEEIEAERQERQDENSKVLEALNNATRNSEEVNNTINTEREERQAEDTKLKEALAAEVKSREDADKQLSDSINTEIEDRKAEDAKLKEAIDAEVTARTDADKHQLDAIEAEVNSRKEKDDELEGRLLQQEGSTFNSETGELTLKSVNGTNDIKVQLSLNFGEF